MLKSLPHRSVHLERDELGRSVIVKRFHHPGLIRGWFDGRRARIEFDSLVELASERLPVPRPLELRRTANGWEVRMEALAAARPLSELLREGRTPPQGWSSLCAALGRALARLQATRVEHRDLHPGNVLVDPDGSFWLIDFHRSRRRRSRLDPVERDLVLAAAAAREAVPPRARARFLLAWSSALPGGAVAREAVRALGERVEREARSLRRASVERGAGRWLRESSRVRRIVRGGESLLVRRDLEERALAAIDARMPGFLVLKSPRSELRARWICAARLFEHGLAVAAPAALAPAWAAFELPPDATHRPHDARDPRVARALGALLGALHERGLEPRSTLVEAAGSSHAGLPFLLPPLALAAIDPLADAPGRWRALDPSGLPGPCAEAFVRGYLEAFARPSERARIETLLR